MPQLPPVGDLLRSVEGAESAELDRIRAAVALADQLGALGDQVVTHFVQAARTAGCTWSQIGAQLGVSKQAAQQAFVAPAPRRRRFSPRGPRRPFERWTDGARAVLVGAQEEARAFGHNYVGTEHLLLGLGQGDGLAARVLAQLGVEQEAMRHHVEAIIGRGRGQAAGRLPFTPRTKKVLELAVREAARLHHDYLGTEHLLLALVREGEGVAAQILVKLGADLPEVRKATLDVLSEAGGPHTRGGPPTG